MSRLKALVTTIAVLFATSAVVLVPSSTVSAQQICSTEACSGGNVPPVVAPVALTFPIKPGFAWHLTQDFAEYNGLPDDAPNKYHVGLDIGADRGTPVYAAATGFAYRYPDPNENLNHGLGNVVIIDHGQGDGPFTLYAHLNAISISTNGSVSGGTTQIGTVGDSGTDDVHLHFELKSRRLLHNPIRPTDGMPTPENCIDSNTCAWGYTCKHPDLLGYFDPILSLHQTTIRTPTTVKVRPQGAGVSLRTGPSTDYRWIGSVGSGAEYRALADAPLSTGCDRGWYLISQTNSVCFNDGVFRLDDAWVCRGNGGVEWLEPSTVTFSLRFVYVATDFAVLPSMVTWGPYHQDTVNGVATFTDVPCATHPLSISGPWVLNAPFGDYSSCGTDPQPFPCERGNCITQPLTAEAGIIALAANAGFGMGDRVEVYNTGGIGLRAWNDICGNGYVVKPEGAQGLVVGEASVCCNGYNRWQIRWDGESVARWSAEGDDAIGEFGEYWLRNVSTPAARTGACCNTTLHDPSCQVTEESACLAGNSGFGGRGTTCSSGCPCANDVRDCDWCWTGTNLEDNCDPSWEGDGDCDCGCQFSDPDCQSTWDENDCTSWSAGGCGSGSCSSTQRAFTRTCPDDCDSPTHKCESDPSCVEEPCEPPEGYEFCRDYDSGSCSVGIAINLYSTVNDIRWGQIVDNNDPYVVGQYQIGWTATDAEKVYYGIDGDACKYGGCNGERGSDTGTRGTVSAPGMAHHDGILAYDDTADFWCTTWYDPFSPGYGADPIYVLRCYNDGDCPSSQRCNKFDNWTTWACIDKKPNGTSCSQASECHSGFCDIDGTGLPDDGWCFTPSNTYFDGQEPNYCEYSAGVGSRNCDERLVGEPLNACIGLSYLAERCSSTCNEEDITEVFDCNHAGCACAEPRCDGLAPGEHIDTCSNGLPYFADACSSTASGRDRGDDICRSATFALGCTAVPACNGVVAGTGNCSLACQLDPPCEALGTHRRKLQPDDVEGLDVWISSAPSNGDDYGTDNDYLRVGKGSDVYYSLIRFDLNSSPQ